MRRALLAIAFALVPAVALAQPVRVELTPFGGYRLKGDFDARSNDVFDSRLNVKIDDSAVYGATLDIPLNRNWQLEILANRQRSSFIVDPGLFEPATNLGDVDLTMVHAGFLLQWGEGQVNPFLTASAGITASDSWTQMIWLPSMPIPFTLPVVAAVPRAMASWPMRSERRIMSGLLPGWRARRQGR